MVGQPTAAREPDNLLSPPIASEPPSLTFQAEPKPHSTPSFDLTTVTVKKLVPQAARQNFRIIEGDDLQPYLSAMEPKEKPNSGTAAPTATDEAPAGPSAAEGTTGSDSMETD